MRKAIRLIQAGFLLIVLSSCVNTQLTGDVDPSVDLSSLKSFYVVREADDDRGIEELIAAELNAMGMTASSGDAAEPPSPVDAVVTYQDKWMWDITMYMLELNIDFRDPETNYPFATARSYRTSLARKSKEEMVSEVLGRIYMDPAAGDAQ